MPESINSKLKEQYDHDDSGGSLDTNLGDFLDSEGASGTSNNSKWRNWAEGTGTSLNTRLFHKHGGSGSFMTRWKNWIAFSSTHSFNFDGSNDYLEIENNPILEPTAELSVSAWAYMDNWSTASNSRIISNTQGGGYALAIDEANDNNISFFVYNGAYLNPNYALSNLSSGWHHICATYKNKTAKLYIDGSLVDTATNTNNTNISYGSNINLFVGGEPDASNNVSAFFNGKIDEVAVHDAELSASDVTSIYNNGKVIDLSKSASYGTDRTANLKLWLRCGDKSEPESTTAIARQDFYTDFDGTDDYVDCGDGSGLGFSGDDAFTITSWIKPANVSSGHSVVAFGTDASSGAGQKRVSLYIYQGKPFFAVWGVDIKHDSAIIQTDEWQHFAITYSGGNTTTANSAIYLNGDSLSLTGGSASALDLSDMDFLHIGADHAPGQYFNGNISNVGIYKTALDAQTISQMAKSRFTPMRDNRFSVVDFDGSNDYIDCGVDVHDFSSGDFTISGWIYHDTANTDTAGIVGVRLNSGVSSDTEVQLYVDSTSNTLASWNGSTNVNSTSAIADEEWTHVALVQSGSNKKFYINGVLDNTASQGNGNQKDTATFKIGWTGNTGEQFLGDISSISVYNVEKSAEEIYAIYQQGITYDESSLSGLVGYWRMGDDTSKAYPTIADSSSNSNDGTMTSMASDDIVQQMVAGYDLGAFESSSEELIQRVLNSDFSNGDTNWTLSSASVVNSVLDVNVGTYTYFVTQSSINQFLANKLYKIEIDITEYTSGTFILYATSTSIKSGVSGASTHTFYYQNDASDKYIRLFSQGSGFDGKINSISVKEVLQSEVSDTYPAIIDVNEPVLGAELASYNIASKWIASGSNTVADVTNGVKITHVDNTGGAEGRLHSSYLLSSDTTSGKIYKVKFNAYYSGGTAPNVKIWTGALNAGIQALTTTETEHIIYYVATGSYASIIFDSVNGSQEIYILNLSVKEIQGNVGTMTNQDSADLVYSSVLPDQSFLATGVNSAYNFIDLDGSDESINAGALNSTVEPPLSISMWIKGSSQQSTLIQDNTLGGGLLYTRNSNELALFTDAGIKSYSYTLDNTWINIVLTQASSAKPLIYVNGSLLPDGSQDGTPTPSFSHIQIGAGWVEFNGSIGQTAIWNKELSSTEVSAIYTAGRHSNLLDSYSDNLVGYWAMSALDAKTGLSDAGDGTIYDRSGNSNHGTATNTESADLKSSPNAEPNGYAKGDTNRSTTTP